LKPPAKQNTPGIERQENDINLAANRQKLFTWQFGRQEIYGNGKMAKAPSKLVSMAANSRQANCFAWLSLVAK